eukprot:CAMPEP_0183734748 /NCGR_PEP_ID=MMETSP0737-20130205/44717_1 /TAXON_ID=385413 /ORGANISM="Thalassiosira miniscula, Strain CCMP1093" /LENGTH=444 /DNA_ID=CAMNT_0025968329 /DNA_START=116 /DNA_END=1446 /DNA_ORIENTATION=-
MCKKSSINTNGGGNNASPPSSSSSSKLDTILGISLFVYTIGFLAFRCGEFIPLIAHRRNESQTAILALFLLRRSLWKAANFRTKCLLLCILMMGLVYIMDVHVPKPLPSANDGNYSDMTVVITGANAGVGYETSKQLAVDYGINVIMGCRSKVKCDNAASSINHVIASSNSKGSATPMIVDLADLSSVQSFISQLQSTNVDVLFNNAGYTPLKGYPVNQYGLDPSFTTMHLSHFFLTEELLKSNPKLRVVNTSSGTHHLCAIPHVYLPQWLYDLFALIPGNFMDHSPGCIDNDYLTKGIRSATISSAYFEAKLANVMHVVELPRRHEGIMAIAIDLGWVGTSIQPWMRGGLNPATLGWMRNAKIGIYPVLRAILTSKQQLMSELSQDSDNNRPYKQSGFLINPLGITEEAFTYPWWGDNNKNNVGGTKTFNVSGEQMRMLSKKL